MPESTTRGALRRTITATAATLGALVAAGAGALGVYAWRNVTAARRGRRAVVRAGFVERRHTLPSGTTLNYAEGPANGPAVVLVHGQAVAWESYAPVLPDLARDFHVFAVDVPGHGSSDRTPGRYDVHSIGADLAAFLEEVVGAPAILSGHSSGGLLAAWVAASAPQAVTAVLLEDPPFFSTDPDRMPQQFNYIDLARPAHEFLAQSTETDFTTWYIEHNAWIQYVGKGRGPIVEHARSYRQTHPDAPLNLWFLPPSVNRTYEHMHEFDPRFAETFYSCRWQAGFDQQATLEAITAPTTLVHARWRVTEDGILEGAMTDADAARAQAALADCHLERVDTGHGFHAEAPAQFVGLLRALRDRAR